jgi:hypothetical protein
MPNRTELVPLLIEPREDLGVEYKGWLDLTQNEHRAVLAKAAIALANSGGGFLVLGMDEDGAGLTSSSPPAATPEVTQDAVNASVRRYASPEFHCELYAVRHPETNVEHPIVSVPGGVSVPIMARRDHAGVIMQNRCYVRKPGPRSEEPTSPEEWRALLDRCLRSSREDMLDAIRAIVTGRVGGAPSEPEAMDLLRVFCDHARDRWATLAGALPPDSPSRFPQGHYELGFGLIGTTPAPSLTELKARMERASSVRHTGWTPFLQMSTPEWAPYIEGENLEAWVGRPNRADWSGRDPSLCDFWRASRAGQLFTMRGYSEDRPGERPVGSSIDLTLPVWRVGEALLYVGRLAESFPGTSAIAVRCSFQGLSGRALVSISGRRAMFGERVSRTGSVELTAEVTPDQIRDNLAEVLGTLLAPLYELFDFFQPPQALFGEELARLRENRF